MFSLPTATEATPGAADFLRNRKELTKAELEQLQKILRATDHTSPANQQSVAAGHYGWFRDDEFSDWADNMTDSERALVTSRNAYKEPVFDSFMAGNLSLESFAACMRRDQAAIRILHDYNLDLIVEIARNRIAAFAQGHSPSSPHVPRGNLEGIVKPHLCRDAVQEICDHHQKLSGGT